MLLSLHVKNLALIEEEEVTFTDGLNILTGETGAGKSIIIGSVNLALGGKADKSIIRTGAEYALIEMVFLADDDRQIRKLEEMDLPAPEDGEWIGVVLLEDAGSALNVRQSPSTGSMVLDRFENGRKVLVCSEPDENGWVKIRTAELVGYVMGSYIAEAE